MSKRFSIALILLAVLFALVYFQFNPSDHDEYAQTTMAPPPPAASFSQRAEQVRQPTKPVRKHDSHTQLASPKNRKGESYGLTNTSFDPQVEPSDRVATNRSQEEAKSPSGRMLISSAKFKDQKCPRDSERCTVQPPAPDSINVVGVVIDSGKLETKRRDEHLVDGRVTPGSYLDDTPALFIK